MAEPRPYRDERDLENMKRLLMEGRQAANGSYYVHVGDLSWWLFYPSEMRDWSDLIHLWEAPDGGLLGWAYLSPLWRTFDVFVRPDLRNTQLAGAMYAWAAERIAWIVRDQGGRDIRTMWIFATDRVVAGWLETQGFTPAEYTLLYLERPLDEPLAAPPVPEGFVLRGVAGEGEAPARAEASYGAFASKLSFDRYLQRYLNFMRSPAYTTGLDLVAAAPDGRIASFCIAWLDPLNRAGLFEPVGTHPDFQRRGLGRAVILEGLRRMQAHGMTRAAICAERDNPAAIRLYKTCGFEEVNRLQTFSKTLSAVP